MRLKCGLALGVLFLAGGSIVLPNYRPDSSIIPARWCALVQAEEVLNPVEKRRSLNILDYRSIMPMPSVPTLKIVHPISVTDLHAVDGIKQILDRDAHEFFFGH